MRVLNNIKEVRDQVNSWKNSGLTIGFVLWDIYMKGIKV